MERIPLRCPKCRCPVLVQPYESSVVVCPMPECRQKYEYKTVDGEARVTVVFVPRTRFDGSIVYDRPITPNLERPYPKPAVYYNPEWEKYS